MECPAFETLAGLVRGDLSDSAALDDHVRSCASCQDTIDRIEGDTADVRRTATLAAAGMQRVKLELEIGAVVGRYVIESTLGEGAMGVVYAARDPELGRLVALKVIKAEVAESERVARLREARAMAAVEHPNVISIYDVGTHRGHPFLAMELVTGSTLKGWLRERARPWRDVLAMFLQAGEGLAAAHEQGLVHRDFKPDNVLVGSDGRARVTDFGLARMVGNETGAEEDRLEVLAGPTYQHALTDTITMTGALIGTPAYMPHEQLRGEAVDATADQFSFCVALFEGLYSVRPFAADSLLDLVGALRTGNIRNVENDNVPTVLRTALLRGLAHEPTDRHPSMRELLSALEEVTVADPSSSERRAAKQASPDETAAPKPESSGAGPGAFNRFSGLFGWAVAALAVGALAAVMLTGRGAAVRPSAPEPSAGVSKTAQAAAAAVPTNRQTTTTAAAPHDVRTPDVASSIPTATASVPGAPPVRSSVARGERATDPAGSAEPAAQPAAVASGKRGPGICTLGCSMFGACVLLKPGRCVARQAEDCRASDSCHAYGSCSYDGRDKCVIASDSDCLGSDACLRWGKCTLQGKHCKATRVADCKRASTCTTNGKCGLKGGKCVAVSTTDCRASSACKGKGHCTKKGSYCAATSDADCKRSIPCAQQGICNFDGKHCVGGSAAKCARSSRCKRQGECGFVKGRCKPTSDAHCKQSTMCKTTANCGLAKGRCGPTTDGHCQQSNKCKRGGNCGLVNGRCLPTSAAHCQQSEICQQDGFCNYGNNSCRKPVGG